MPRLKNAARQARVEERQAQILSAAARVFARKGYERATIADIAKEAHVAEGSIYNYFKNKADLLVHIPRQLLGPTIEGLREVTARTAGGPLPPPEEMLPAMGRAVAAAIRENAYILRIILTALPNLKPAARREYVELVVSYAANALEAYFRGQHRRGVLRADLDPAIAARQFIGMLFPFLMFQEILLVEDRTAFDMEQVIAQAVETFLCGALAAKREDAR